MTAVLVEIPEDLAEPLERQANALNVDVARYIGAVVREKLRIPVRIGDLEVFAPADVLESEMRRADGETDEEFAEANEMYDRLFRAATR